MTILKIKKRYWKNISSKEHWWIKKFDKNNAWDKTLLVLVLGSSIMILEDLLTFKNILKFKMSEIYAILNSWKKKQFWKEQILEEHYL